MGALVGGRLNIPDGGAQRRRLHQTLHGWFLRSTQSPAWFTAVVFNGNAGNRAFRSPLVEALRRAGCVVLLFDYRGFGENAGTPTEAGL
jgi:fermentation-respiration switch protein FrsA (DUF1100 family)